MDEKKERPKVGIGVIVIRGDEILLGERLSSHGAGTFEIPGGHLEFGETFADAARRKVEEETGLNSIVIKGVISLNNDIAYGKHYVSIGILAEAALGNPYDAEPEHSRNWKWYKKQNLPEPIFPHSKRVIDNWMAGRISREAV